MNTEFTIEARHVEPNDRDAMVRLIRTVIAKVEASGYDVAELLLSPAAWRLISSGALCLPSARLFGIPVTIDTRSDYQVTVVRTEREPQ